MLVNYTIQEFSRILGSDSPAPGGGSVAALSGALGANLVSMVCSLSIGKHEYEVYQDILKECLKKAQSFSNSLLKRVDLDTEAFNGVMAAFKMPKATEEEKSARKNAIQAGYKEAVQSPLGIATECLEVLRLMEKILGKFNTNAMSDFGVAAQQVQSGLEGAVMNVRINLPSIKDELFVAETDILVVRLLDKGKEISSRIYIYVQENLG